MPRITHKKFYLSALQKYGHDVKALQWISKERQEKRFSILLQNIKEPLNSLNIADAGCGFGDLYGYMQRQKNTPKSYIGIDILAPMLKVAKAKYKKATFMQADITKDALVLADYYLCSGALNTFTHFETLLALQNMLTSSKKGVVFNILYGNKESKIYNYVDKNFLEEIQKFAKIQNITYGYMEHDITIFLQKATPL